MLSGTAASAPSGHAAAGLPTSAVSQRPRPGTVSGPTCSATGSRASRQAQRARPPRPFHRLRQPRGHVARGGAQPLDLVAPHAQVRRPHPPRVALGPPFTARPAPRHVRDPRRRRPRPWARRQQRRAERRDRRGEPRAPRRRDGVGGGGHRGIGYLGQHHPQRQQITRARVPEVGVAARQVAERRALHGQRVRGARQAEIEEVDAPVRAEEQVVRLHVPVRRPDPVQIGERLAGAARDPQRQRHRVGAAGPGIERLPLDPPQREERARPRRRGRDDPRRLRALEADPPRVQQLGQARREREGGVDHLPPERRGSLGRAGHLERDGAQTATRVGPVDVGRAPGAGGSEELKGGAWQLRCRLESLHYEEMVRHLLAFVNQGGSALGRASRQGTPTLPRAGNEPPGMRTDAPTCSSGAPTSRECAPDRRAGHLTRRRASRSPAPGTARRAPRRRRGPGPARRGAPTRPRRARRGRRGRCAASPGRAGS